MNVLLIFPPLFNPTQPYLAPVQIQTLLRQLTSWRVDVLDWSLKSYSALLSPGFVARAAELCGVEAPNGLVERLARADDGLKQADHAYTESVRAIDDAFNWYGQAFPSLRLFRYCGVQPVGWNMASSDDLLGFAKSRLGNIFSALYDELVLPNIMGTHYDAVGISLVCADQLPAAATLAVRLAEQRQRPRLVLGGALATILSTRASTSAFLRLFDTVYHGTARSDITEAFAPGCSASDLQPSEGRWLRPDWGDTDFEAYVCPEPVVPIQATAGCLFNCQFCSSPTVSELVAGVRYSERAPDDIAAEIRAHVSAGRKYFFLVGETITWEHASDIADALATHGVEQQAAWYFWARLSPCPTQALLNRLRIRGCRRICFGLETTDQEALTVAHKGVPVSIAEESLIRTIQADIQPHLFLMTGLPRQTRSLADHGLVTLLSRLIQCGAYGITATISPLEVEAYAPWGSSLPSLTPLQESASDLRISLPATAEAEDHAEHLRRVVNQRLADQTFLGAFGNAHQVVFLDRSTVASRIV